MFLPPSLICAPITTSAAATCRPHSGHFRVSSPLLVVPSPSLDLTSLTLFYFPSQSQGLCFSLWVSYSLSVAQPLSTFHHYSFFWYHLLRVSVSFLTIFVFLFAYAFVPLFLDPVPPSLSPFSGVLTTPPPHLLLFSERTLGRHSDPPSPAHF